MRHKVIITKGELKEMIAKKFGVGKGDVNFMADNTIEVDLGDFHVNSEIVVKGE